MNEYSTQYAVVSLYCTVFEILCYSVGKALHRCHQDKVLYMHCLWKTKKSSLWFCTWGIFRLIMTFTQPPSASGITFFSVFSVTLLVCLLAYHLQFLFLSIFLSVRDFVSPLPLLSRHHWFTPPYTAMPPSLSSLSFYNFFHNAAATATKTVVTRTKLKIVSRGWDTTFLSPRRFLQITSVFYFPF